MTNPFENLNIQDD